MMTKANVILLDKDQADFYNSGKEVEVGSKKVKTTVLKTLLKDKFYAKLIELFYSGQSHVKAGFSECAYDNLLCDLTYAEFSRALNYFLLDGSINEKQFKRIIKIKEMTSFDAFIQKYRDKFFDLEIDKEKYIFKYRDIIDFMTLEDDQFDEIIKNTKSIKGYPIEVFLYAVKRTLHNSEISYRYNFPTYMKKRIKSIKNSDVVDIEALNDIVVTDDCKLDKIELNPEFEKEIMDSIPEDYNDLEKALFIYIKLCKTLTYDPLYFAMGKNINNHNGISRLKTIDRKNNIVVCYEFNSIYGYFLNKLGINYYATNGDKDQYGNKHASLYFRVGKYIVAADSVTSILAGDLVRAKSYFELNGIKLVNTNLESNKEFEEMLKKVYYNASNLRTNLLKALRNSVMISKMSVKERLEYIIDKVNKENFKTMDNLGYIFCQRHRLFTDEEKENIIKYTIIRTIEDRKLKLEAIFSIKEDENDRYDYFSYIPNKELKEVSLEDLEKRFIEDKYQYINMSNNEIPGLLDSGEVLALIPKK